MIPLVNLKTQYQNIKLDIDNAIQSVINETAFHQGRHVKEFEENFAKYIGVKHCIGVANCTDALEIVQLALGVTGEVITTAHSFIATSEAITSAHAMPVFVDIDVNTYNISTKLIQDKINEKTTAILPVHLYGQAVDMKTLLAIANKHNLHIIEDCAQACGTKWHGLRVGSIGEVGCFSFYPGKNLGAYGDAGAITTNDDTLAVKVREIANHGGMRKFEHKFEGRSSRLDGLQAAILNAKLPYLDTWNALRFERALLYTKYLSNVDEIFLPHLPEDAASHIFHLYVIQIDNRDYVKDKLQKMGISTGIHYPEILPNLRAYAYMNNKTSDFPIGNRMQDRILSLPLYPELEDGTIKYICDTLKEIVSEK